MIHSPAGVVAARSRILETMSSCDVASHNFERIFQHREMEQGCVSTNPGSTVAPPRSTKRAPVPATARMSASDPVATMRPSRTTTAVAAADGFRSSD